MTSIDSTDDNKQRDRGVRAMSQNDEASNART